MTDKKIDMGLISDLVKKKLEKLENLKESEGSEWSKVQGNIESQRRKNTAPDMEF